jgi:N-methylhydantoinase B/oxoprolinase/acetone carboxylase alpha subunit
VAAEQPDEFNWRSATSETPSGVWTAKGATSAWNAEDTPMLLHTFEYIVRNALQNWWESMDSAADHGDVRAVAAPPAGDDP